MFRGTCRPKPDRRGLKRSSATLPWTAGARAGPGATRSSGSVALVGLGRSACLERARAYQSRAGTAPESRIRKPAKSSSVAAIRVSYTHRMIARHGVVRRSSLLWVTERNKLSIL